ncbi:spore coat protein [Candidatus Contubernalis alkaliaceticus]|uniref:spore coat protein n=1 Tax=Candidatus Contubernalis alkaliaceticus TaxID=338645 RepID=UPI001F4C2A23|nr:spore coat protein [Candidatus Contubernalis alkalaceticus]UNC92836.1 spore coat protein [Candidatus Contubernalis alkalaceticus]
MDTQSTITTKTGAVKIGKEVTAQLPKKKDATVNDRDRLNDILLHEKHMLTGYSTGINEVLDPILFNLLQENREQLQQVHQQMLEALFDMGEYTADIALRNQVVDAYDVFSGYKTQFPYPENELH